MNNHILKDRRNQCGSVAIEFAFILPVLVLVLALTLFFGRVFSHYTIAQKAAHDASMMLANATKVEMGARKLDLSDIEVANLAKTVAAEEIAELNPGLGGLPRVEVFCDNAACIGGAAPNEVRVLIRLRIVDNIFSGFTDQFGGNEGFLLTADVRMPYVGN
jgi:hypothetical protein